jgi:quinol monooxygenase YgiN
MVRLTVALPASPRSARNLMDALRTLIVGTRIENGCVGCSLWADPDSTVHYFEEWATEEDIRRRVRSERFTSLLSLLEASRSQPEVRFDFLAATRGLDYVTEIRQAPGP